MTYVRYPFVTQNQFEIISDEMELEDSKLYPPDVIPFNEANLIRIQFLLNNHKLAILPGCKFENTYSVFFQGLSGCQKLFASDYCLIYAYLRTYLHNLGQTDAEMTIFADRRYDLWQEIAIMTIGFNRLEKSLDNVNKILLIEPVGLFSSFDLKPAQAWMKKIFKFTETEFDLAVSSDQRINAFNGNIMFDLKIYLDGQLSVISAIRLCIAVYPKLKVFKAEANQIINQINTNPEDTISVKKLFDDFVLNFKHLKAETIDKATEMINEVQLRAQIYSKKYDYSTNDMIVTNRILGELTGRINECEAILDRMTLASVHQSKLQMFLFWYASQLSVYSTLEKKFSLVEAPIDRYTILEQVEECEYMFSYTDLVDRKIGEFDETLEFFFCYRGKGKEIEAGCKKIKQNSERLLERIIEFGNKNENNDDLLIKKLYKFLSERNRLIVSKLRGVNFFEASISKISNTLPNNLADDRNKSVNSKNQQAYKESNNNNKNDEADDLKFEKVVESNNGIKEDPNINNNSNDETNNKMGHDTSLIPTFDNSPYDKNDNEEKKIDFELENEIETGRLENDLMNKKIENVNKQNEEILISFD